MIKNKLLNFKVIIPLLFFFMISILSIKSASVYTSKSLGNLVIKQSIWYLVGCGLVIIILKLKNNFLYKYSLIFYILCNLLLLSLLFFAPQVNNSRCWFIIPGIGSFQPSEFMKLSIMLMLAVMIKNYHLKHSISNYMDEFKFLIKTFIIVLIPSILTFLEPDTGAVIMYFVIYFSMIIISGIRMRWFIFLGIIILILLGIMFILYFFYSDTFIKIFGTKLFYRFDRIFEWKNGTGLQLENAVSAIGAGGLIGFGFNKTPLYFPESSTDFIFAVFSSNFGFVISLMFLIFTIFFDLYLILLIRKNYDLRDKFILVGITSCLIFQQIENIGMTIGLLPIAGITLPFISYGGSSLLSYMLLVGMIFNISNESLRFTN